MGNFTSAVILAAGSGTRFGGKVKKQFTDIAGTPCIIRTLRAFEASKLIDEIVLVGDTEALRALVDEYGVTKVSAIVNGGETRQDSALFGFDAVNSKCKYVAIHDAARCLVTTDIIEKTVRAAYKCRAAAAAHKCEDTVKKCDGDGNVESTLDRNMIWTVQTPQAFEADVYRVAAYMAKRDGAVVTDDCMLCERLGFKVKMVECGRNNIKLTSPEDLALCEALILSQSKDEIENI